MNSHKKTSIDKIYCLSQQNMAMQSYNKLVSLDSNRISTLKNNHIVIIYK